MAELKNPEQEMFSFFEMTLDLACIAGKDGYFKKINPAVINKLGYTKEELFSKPIATFIHPDDKEVTASERKKLLEGQALLNFQNRYLAKDGAIIWLEWTSVYFPEKELVFAIAKDVSKRKKVEKEIEEKYTRFKSLATHFKTSIEKDRKYFAVELHEELAQLAAVVKMDLDFVTVHEKSLSAAALKRIEHASAVSALLINTIRRISFSVSPNMLDDLGLDETLKWLCCEFSFLHNIPCKFESKYKEEMLTHEAQLDFFRICQEALNNIARHAEAKNVKISIEDVGDKICLCISDDGKGFNSKGPGQKSGITNMKERAASINGRLQIHSEPGKGTEVSLEIIKNLLFHTHLQ